MGDKIHFKRRELIKSISETFDEESFNNHSFRKSILLILKFSPKLPSELIF